MTSIVVKLSQESVESKVAPWEVWRLYWNKVENQFWREIFCFLDSDWEYMKLFANLSLLSVLRDCLDFLLLMLPVHFARGIHPSTSLWWKFMIILFNFVCAIKPDIIILPWAPFHSYFFHYNQAQRWDFFFLYIFMFVHVIESSSLKNRNFIPNEYISLSENIKSLFI